MSTLSLSDNNASHICRSMLISSICSEEYPLPGVDCLLVHHLAIIWNMTMPPTTIHLKRAWDIRLENLVETEIVNLANKLDILLVLHGKRFDKIPGIITKYNEAYCYFLENRANITTYYPYINRMLTGVIDDWKRDFSGKDLFNSDVEERKTTELHIL